MQIIPHEVFLGRGYVGLIFSLALLYFLFWRFASPVRELSVPEDYYLLILLFLIALFGSEMDWGRRWFGYEELTVEVDRTYLLSLLYLKPELPEAVTDDGHSFMLALWRRRWVGRFMRRYLRFQINTTRRPCLARAGGSSFEAFHLS